jgi:hypothetical protein
MLSRIPGDYHGTVAFEVEIEGQKTKMSIDWATLEKQFECTIKATPTLKRCLTGILPRSIAREDGCYKVELKHFNSLPDGYPVD